MPILGPTDIAILLCDTSLYVPGKTTPKTWCQSLPLP